MPTNIGMGPQDIPLNQFLGQMAFKDKYEATHFKIMASDPSSGVVGECYWNTTNDALRVYDGTSWEAA